MLTTQRSQGVVRGPLRERARHAMNKLIAGQSLAAVALTLILGVWFGKTAAYSALVGAIIAIVPNFYLARRLLRSGPGATPSESLRGIYTGELLKIAFTIALFVIAIRLLNVVFLIVVTSYLAMVASNWLALLFIDVGEAPQSPATGAASVSTNG